MGRTKTVSYRLASLFPPDDDYAATMARICILWEDLITEASAGRQTSIREMDGNSPQWRRLYFLRRSIGTVHEIGRALHTLRGHKEFKEAVSKQSHYDRDGFETRYEILTKHRNDIKTFRNDIGGGHVQQGAIQKGINTLNSELSGLFQFGEFYGDIRFKFAYQLTQCVMFPFQEEQDPEQELAKVLTVIEKATTNALRLVEFVFAVYVKERGITPL